jgi:hypothetical protein
VVLEPARGLIFDRNGLLLANNVPSFALYVTLEDVKDRAALVGQLASLLSLDPELIQKKLSIGKGGKLQPRKIKDRLTLREATLIESHRLDLPGVMIQVESQRNYPAGTWRRICWGMSARSQPTSLKNRILRTCIRAALSVNMALKNGSIVKCAGGRGRRVSKSMRSAMKNVPSCRTSRWRGMISTSPSMPGFRR